jgi:hypothetical protein
MPVFGVARFERFFRAAAGLDVDKDDLKRYRDFVHHKLYDLLLFGQVTAEANKRDLIEPHNLPITKGMQEWELDDHRRRHDTQRVPGRAGGH